MARHTISNAVDLYSGEAVKNGFLGSNRGLPIDLLILDDLGAPAVADVDGYVNGLNVTGASNFSLKTATGALVDANDVGVADVARGVQIVSAGADTAVLTITGTDKFGTALSEAITLDGTTIVFGKKAFKKVSQIASDGTTTNNIDVGTSDLLGLTYRVENAEDVVAIYEDNAAGRTSRGAALAAPASVSAVALAAVGGAALTENSTQGTPDLVIGACTGIFTSSSGSGLTTGQSTEFDSLEVLIDDNFANMADQLNKINVNQVDTKVQVDKLVLDLAAQKVELDKLILDVDLGTVGSFVKAVTTTATTTTGDVRGTYDPKITLNGVRTIKVLLRPQSRTSLGAYGVAQA